MYNVCVCEEENTRVQLSIKNMALPLLDILPRGNVTKIQSFILCSHILLLRWWW